MINCRMVVVDVANSKLDVLLVVKFIIKSSSLHVCCLESSERLRHSLVGCLFSYVTTNTQKSISASWNVCWCLVVDADLVYGSILSNLLFKFDEHFFGGVIHFVYQWLELARR